jgi:uncharacterized membrane protein
MSGRYPARTVRVRFPNGRYAPVKDAGHFPHIEQIQPRRWRTLGFLLSFVVIGGNWAARRRVFRYANRLTSRVGALNMIWLLMMILAPFTARLLAAVSASASPFTPSYRSSPRPASSR